MRYTRTYISDIRVYITPTTPAVSSEDPGGFVHLVSTSGILVLFLFPFSFLKSSVRVSACRGWRKAVSSSSSSSSSSMAHFILLDWRRGHLEFFEFCLTTFLKEKRKRNKKRLSIIITCAKFYIAVVTTWVGIYLHSRAVPSSSPPLPPATSFYNCTQTMYE